jgi:type VI protein secretion system component VasA
MDPNVNDLTLFYKEASEDFQRDMTLLGEDFHDLRHFSLWMIQNKNNLQDMASMEDMMHAFCIFSARLRMMMNERAQDWSWDLAYSLCPELIMPLPALAFGYIAEVPVVYNDYPITHQTEWIWKDDLGSKHRFRSGYEFPLKAIAQPKTLLCYQSMLPSCFKTFLCDFLMIQIDVSNISFSKEKSLTLRFFIDDIPERAWRLRQALVYASHEMAYVGAYLEQLSNISLDSYEIVSMPGPTFLGMKEMMLFYNFSTHKGNQLFLEHVNYPEKNLFFEIKWLEASTIIGKKICVWLPLDASYLKDTWIRKDILKLNVYPLLNQYIQNTQPVAWDVTSEEIPLIGLLNPQDMISRVLSVQWVTSTGEIFSIPSENQESLSDKKNLYSQLPYCTWQTRYDEKQQKFMLSLNEKKLFTLGSGVVYATILSISSIHEALPHGASLLASDGALQALKIMTLDRSYAVVPMASRLHIPWTSVSLLAKNFPTFNLQNLKNLLYLFRRQPEIHLHAAEKELYKMVQESSVDRGIWNHYGCVPKEIYHFFIEHTKTLAGLLCSVWVEMLHYYYELYSPLYVMVETQLWSKSKETCIKKWKQNECLSIRFDDTP